MKAKDLRERSAEDLRELEKSLAKDTFQNRFKNFTNRLDDTSQIKKTRRELARVKTLLHEAARKVALGTAAEGAEATAPAKKPAKKKAAAPKKAAAHVKSAETKSAAAPKKKAPAKKKSES